MSYEATGSILGCRCTVYLSSNVSQSLIRMTIFPSKLYVDLPLDVLESSKWHLESYRYDKQHYCMLGETAHANNSFDCFGHL